jgi:nucleoside triphosphate diphosphatase
MRPSRDIEGLLEIMAALRAPETGCPWDVEQDFASIAPYTIEEAYEVADAVARGDMADLKDELGDLLLQVVFHTRMAEEESAFDFADVCEAITGKLIRRHPHVFGDAAASAPDPESVRRSWEDIKAEEELARGQRTGSSPASLLDDVPLALPALTRAVKLQKRAARVGFDWNDPQRVLDKVREEVDEMSAAMRSGNSKEMTAELGDILFAVANLARHLDIDPETALRDCNDKFRRRFGHIEQRAAETGHQLGAAGLEQMETWWAEAKQDEIGAPDQS